MNTKKLDKITPDFPVLRADLTTQPPTLANRGDMHDLSPTRPHEAAMDAAVETARHLGRAVRITVTHPPMRKTKHIVTPDGDVTDLNTGATSSTPKTTTKPASSGPSMLSVPNMPNMPKPILIGAAALLVLVLVGGVLFTVMSINSGKDTQAEVPQGPGPAAPAGELYAVPPPPGFSPHAAWQVPVGEDTVVDVNDAGSIAAITPNDRSVNADATAYDDIEPRYLTFLNTDGQAEWSSPLPEESKPDVGPAFTRIDGTDVIAGVWNNTLAYWPLNGTEPTLLELPRANKVHFTGTSPLITDGKEQAATVTKGKITNISVPHLTTPMSAHEGGITSAEATGTWWNSSSKATPTPVAPETPKGASSVANVVRIVDDRVLVLWNTPPEEKSRDVGKNVVAAVHDRNDGSVVEAKSIDGAKIKASDDVVASPNAIGFGPLVFRFGEGDTAVEEVPDFSPLAITATAAYGDRGRDLVAHTAETKHLAANTALPWAASENRIIVASNSTIYALDPEEKPAQEEGDK